MRGAESKPEQNTVRTQKGRLAKQDWGQNLKGEIFQVGLEEMW